MRRRIPLIRSRNHSIRASLFASGAPIGHHSLAHPAHSLAQSRNARVYLRERCAHWASCVGASRSFARAITQCARRSPRAARPRGIMRPAHPVRSLAQSRSARVAFHERCTHADITGNGSPGRARQSGRSASQRRDARLARRRPRSAPRPPMHDASSVENGDAFAGPVRQLQLLALGATSATGPPSAAGWEIEWPPASGFAPESLVVPPPRPNLRRAALGPHPAAPDREV
jgi:hypothetical protein